MSPSMPIELIVANQIHRIAERHQTLVSVVPDAMDALNADPALGEAIARDLLMNIAKNAPWHLVSACLAVADAPAKDELVQRYRAAIDRMREASAKAAP